MSLRFSLVLVLPFAAVVSATASEREFTYVYDSGVAAPGTKEVEVWTTLQRGRVNSFNRAVNRVEFEVGLTDRLQTSLYLNFERTTEDGVSEEEHSGSWEWKYKFADNAADPVGFSLYEETSLSSDEFELEFKAIVDKRIGEELFAFNATYEPEWSIVQNDSGLVEQDLEFTLGWSHRFSPRWTAGLELRNHNEIVKDDTASGSEWEWENSALFFGPVVHVAWDQFWFTATALPQVVALKGKSEGENLDLNDHERFELRAIAGIKF